MSEKQSGGFRAAHRPSLRESRWLALVVVGLIGSCSADLGSPPSGFDGDSLFDDVRAYDALGVHRTATPADLGTTAWQWQHLEELGLQVTLGEVRLRQQFPSRVELVVGGDSLEIEPQWPVTFAAEVLAAPLVWVGDSPTELPPTGGWIAALSFPYSRRASITPHLETIGTLFESGALAVVAATRGPTGGIISLNTPGDAEPFPGPVVLARGSDAERLRELASRRAEAELRVEGSVEDAAPAYNVIGRIDRGERWIVVSTPQSGWTHCAGERGPGIAIWRALASWAASASTPASFLFLSTTGHELGHLGLEEVIASDGLPPPQETDLWLHLGAGIASYDYEAEKGEVTISRAPHRGRFLMGTWGALPGLFVLFASQPGLFPLPAIERLSAGEFKAVLREGYRPAVGFFGSSLNHHVDLDRPEVTGPELLEPVAIRILELVRRASAAK